MQGSVLDSSLDIPGPTEAERLRSRVQELEVLLGRAVARVERLERDLAASREQVAWFHRQLFGAKAERVPRAELQDAWLAFCREQEAKTRPSANAPAAEEHDKSSSFQLLLDLSGLADPTVPKHPGPSEASALEVTSHDAPVDEAEPAVPSKEEAEPQSSPHASVSSDGQQDPSKPNRDKPKRKGHGRRVIPEHLPSITLLLEPEPNEEALATRKITAEVSYRLGIRRAEVVRIAVVRERRAVDLEDGTTKIETAPAPDEMIPRGMFAPSGLAHIIAGKWDYHLPWTRIQRAWAIADFPISVSTLSGVALRAAPLARDLVRAIHAHARVVAPYLAIDATTARILRQKETRHHSYGWARYIDGVCVLFDFTEKHNSDVVDELLEGWTCPTLADGASVYDRKHRETGNPRGGCWSHARRKLFYATPSDGRALVGLNLINQLFAVEAELADADPDVRLQERRRRSQPVIDALFAWRDELLRESSIGYGGLRKALRYLVNQQERLTYFLRNGKIPIHNNRTELQIKHFAIGRKNWLYLGSPAAADAAATWLSLILSARMHGLTPELYLRDLFRVLPSWPKPRLLELAPHRWRDTRSRLLPAELELELGPLTIPPRLVADP